MSWRTTITAASRVARRIIASVLSIAPPWWSFARLSKPETAELIWIKVSNRMGKLFNSKCLLPDALSFGVCDFDGFGNCRLVTES